MNRAVARYIIIGVISVLFVAAFLYANAAEAMENTVFLRDGGAGDGKSFDSALGDFKEAVRLLADTGGNIVICGKYTYNELIVLSEKSGTSNGDKLIRVTSVYDGNDYRVREKAALYVGDGRNSGNMILDGRFIFEDLNIVADSNGKERAIICCGWETVFGEGIVCKKADGSPFISVVGVSLDEKITADGSLTIKSGSYFNICAGSRNGEQNGNTRLVIDGGVFEGNVSVSGLESGEGEQRGSGYLEINGGSFQGSAGALTALSGEFTMTVNGGSFKKDITALGKYNTLNVNGGSLQGVNSIKIADYIAPPVETDDRGETVDTGGEIKQTVVNVNVYSGDVKKLTEKITGQGVIVNINTEGGSDSETTVHVNENTQESPETEDDVPSESESESDGVVGEGKADRNYVLGTRERTIFAIIGIAALMALAVIMLAYRSVYRKK